MIFSPSFNNPIQSNLYNIVIGNYLSGCSSSPSTFTLFSASSQASVLSPLHLSLCSDAPVPDSTVSLFWGSTLDQSLDSLSLLLSLRHHFSGIGSPCWTAFAHSYPHDRSSSGHPQCLTVPPATVHVSEKWVSYYDDMMLVLQLSNCRSPSRSTALIAVLVAPRSCAFTITTSENKWFLSWSFLPGVQHFFFFFASYFPKASQHGEMFISTVYFKRKHNMIQTSFIWHFLPPAGRTIHEGQAQIPNPVTFPEGRCYYSVGFDLNIQTKWQCMPYWSHHWSQLKPQRGSLNCLLERPYHF